MAKRYFRKLTTAKREAKKSGKGVYKLSKGVYYVGNYKDALKSWQRKAKKY